VLALAISEGARRRRDARLLLIGLAFVVSAGFLGLHALATPTVFIAGKNAGFVVATPVGLILAGCLAAASAVEYRLETSLWIVRHGRLLLGIVLAVIVGWAVVSLAELPPLERAVTPAEINAPLGAFAAAGVVAYAYAAFAYFRIYHRRGSGLAFAIAFAFALLAEALVVAVLSLATSWQLSWWEWHGLMTIGFVTIGVAAGREWHEERFSALYLDETLRGHKEVSVLFADLAGFTPFTEERGSADVHAMLVTYFGRLAPMIRDEFGGEVAEFVGDQIFAVFNKAGDQPDHAVRAARAALALQRAAAEIRAEHPDWPHFRVGVNTGEVLAGVVGDRGHRIHGVFGDTVNLGSRLEGQSPVDGVMVGAATFERLPPGAVAERQPDLHVKGKSEPVVAYVLRDLP
jgi:adenylate cyclase